MNEHLANPIFIAFLGPFIIWIAMAGIIFVTLGIAGVWEAFRDITNSRRY